MIEVKLENNKIYVSEKIFPISGYGNNYWDAVTLERGENSARIIISGGGDGWARRSSMFENWEYDDFIPAKEFDTWSNAIRRALQIENEIDRRAELERIGKKIINHYIG